MLVNSLPSSPLLSSGMKPQFWLKEEMNPYFSFMMRHRMLMHNLLKGSWSGQVREQARETALPQSDAAQSNTGL